MRNLTATAAATLLLLVLVAPSACRDGDERKGAASEDKGAGEEGSGKKHKKKAEATDDEDDAPKKKKQGKHAEKGDEAEAASAASAEPPATKPSASTTASAAPAVACPATFDTAPVPAKRLATWLEIYDALATKAGPKVSPANGAARPKLPADAKKQLVQSGDDEVGVSIVRYGEAHGPGVNGLVYADAQGALWLWDDLGGGGQDVNCSWADEAMLGQRGRLVEVFVDSQPSLLGHFDGAGNDCSPKGNADCHEACTWPKWTRTAQYYDLVAQRRVLSAAESGAQKELYKHTTKVSTVQSPGGDVAVRGGGCDRTVKLTLAPKPVPAPECRAKNAAGEAITLTLDWGKGGGLGTGTLQVGAKTTPVVAEMYKGLVLVDATGAKSPLQGKLATVTSEGKKSIRVGDSRQPSVPCD
jgi:hypothetical protein